jgi:hypothetical protein
LRSDTPPGVSEKKDVIIFNRESVGVALPADVSMNGLLDRNTAIPVRRSSQVVEQHVVGAGGRLLGKVILSAGRVWR